MDVTSDLGFLRCLSGFFLGQLVYFAHVTFARKRQRFGNVVEIAVFAFGTFFVVVAGRSSLSFAAPLVFGVLVYVFANSSGWLSNALRSGIIQFLGLVSYSIYMIHAPAIAGSNMVLELATKFVSSIAGIVTFNGETTYWLFGNLWAGDVVSGAFVLAVIGSAYLTFRFIELPGKDLIASMVRSRRAALERQNLNVETTGRR